MPNEYVNIALWVLGALAVVLGGIVFMLWLVVYTASRPGFRLREADRAKYRIEFAHAAQLDGWLRERGFEWVGGYEVRLPIACFLGGWKQPDGARYFLNCSAMGTEFCLVTTVFENDQSLTTCDTKEEHTLPYPPGKFLQTFHKVSHDELWQRHTEAEQYLARSYGIVPGRGELPPVDEYFAESPREQARYVKSHLLWPLRAPWWYFTRGFRSNRSIEQQDQSGKLAQHAF